MAYEVKEQYDVEGGVLEDEGVYLTAYASKQQYGSLLRRVHYLDRKTGKEYVFLTDNHHWDAQAVTNMYKERWTIKVFFNRTDVAGREIEAASGTDGTRAYRNF